MELLRKTIFSGITKFVGILLTEFYLHSGDTSLLPFASEVSPDFDVIQSLKSTFIYASEAQANSLLGQLQVLLTDFFRPSPSGNFIPLSVKRSLLLQQARLLHSLEDLDHAMSLNYEVEMHRIGNDRILPNFDRIAIRWIIVEVAYDKNSGVFCIGRWCGQDDAPVIIFPPNEIITKIDTLFEVFHSVSCDNDKSFNVTEELKTNPDFVRNWWIERKRIDSEMARVIMNMDRDIFSPFSFLFKTWKRGKQFEEAIDSLLQHIQTNNPLVSTFLHCNEIPLTPESLLSTLNLLGISLENPISPQLLHEYNETVYHSVDKIDLILILSPLLQNFPLESLPLFQDSRYSISRHFCLQSISDSVFPQECVCLRNGQYVLNISVVHIPICPSHFSQQVIYQRQKRNFFLFF